MWLNIGLHWKITKTYTTHVYPQNRYSIPENGGLFLLWWHTLIKRIRFPSKRIRNVRSNQLSITPPGENNRKTILAEIIGKGWGCYWTCRNERSYSKRWKILPSNEAKRDAASRWRVADPKSVWRRRLLRCKYYDRWPSAGLRRQLKQSSTSRTEGLHRVPQMYKQYRYKQKMPPEGRFHLVHDVRNNTTYTLIKFQWNFTTWQSQGRHRKTRRKMVS